MYTVYKHTSPSGKVYIGITSRKPEYRWNYGKGYANSYFHNAIQKYGWESIKHEILYTDLTKEEAEQKEIELIAQYKSNNPEFGYNISSGGEFHATGAGWKLSNESILKRSGKNHWAYGRHLSETEREHLSLINSGVNHPMYGTHRSELTKFKISKAQKGKVIPIETRVKISDSLKGNIPVNRKPVLCVETGEVFNSLSDAMKAKNITCIWKALRDETKTAAGFHWKYI